MHSHRGCDKSSLISPILSQAVTNSDLYSYKHLIKPTKIYSTKGNYKNLNGCLDFMIVKEILNHAFANFKQELIKNPNTKLDQVRLLSSYEQILKSYGIDPITDGFFYRIIMKIQNNKSGLDLFSALDREIQKSNYKRIALNHYQKCLEAKSYFSLVSNMVNAKVSAKSTSRKVSIGSSATSTRKRSSQKSSVDKENIYKNNTQQIKGRKNEVKNEYYQMKEERKTTKVMKKSSTSQNILPKSYALRSRESNHVIKNMEQQSNILQQQNTFFTSQNLDFNSNGTASNKFEQSSSTISLPKTKATTYGQTLQSQQLRYIETQEEQDLNLLKQSTSMIKTNEYKVLLKCMRIWKNDVKVKKAKRDNKEKFLEQWALSIHFHEQTLMNKACIAMHNYALKSKVMDHNIRRTQVMNQVYQRKRYFKKWLRIFKGHSRRKEQVFKALDHWGNAFQSKIIRRWRQYSQAKQNWILHHFNRYSSQPISVLCLLTMKNSGGSGLQSIYGQIRNKQVRNRVVQEFQRYNVRKAFNSLKTQINNKKDIEQQAFYFHLRFILTTMRKQLQKKIIAKKNEAILKQEMRNKMIWSFFANWLNATTQQLIKKDHDYKAESHYNHTLIQKAIRSFLIHLTSRQLAKSQLKKSVCTNLNKLTSKSFEGWKFVTFYNRKNRMLQAKARILHYKAIKSQFFMQWIKSAIISCKARMNYENTLKRKLMQTILNYIEIRDNKVQRVKSSEYYHRQRRERIVFNQWKKFTRKNKNERTLKRTVFKFRDDKRKQAILNGWKESIEIIKKEKDLNEKSQNLKEKLYLSKYLKQLVDFAQYQKQQRRNLEIGFTNRIRNQYSQTFQQWKNFVDYRISLRQKEHQTKIIHLKCLLSHYLGFWVFTSFNRNEQRITFYRTRARNLLLKALNGLKFYSRERIQFRKGLHQFLKLRAQNLLQNAFLNLKENRKQSMIRNKYRKVASFVFLQNILRKCFDSFKSILIQKQKKLYINHKISLRMKQKYLQDWKVKYLRNDIVKRLNQRKDNVIVFKALKLWQQFRDKKRQDHYLMIQGLQKYGARLLKQSLMGLRINIEKHRQSRIKQFKVYRTYLLKVCQKAMYYWSFYSNIKSKQKCLVNAIQEKNRLQLQSIVFEALRYQTHEIRYQRSILQPYLINKQRRVQRSCLLSLYKYTFQRSIIRANYKKYTDSKNQQQKLSILDAFYRYKLYSQSVAQLNQKAYNFLTFNLSRKIFYAFLRNKLVSTCTKDIIKQAQLNFQHRFLQKWINAYNESQQYKPMIGMAELYKKKVIFDHFVQQIRIQRQKKTNERNLKIQAIQYFENSCKSYGVKRLYQFSQLRKLQKMKKTLAHKIFIKKVFSQWKANLEHIKQNKTLYCIQVNFRKYSLLKRGFKNIFNATQLCRQREIKIQMNIYQKQLDLYRNCLNAILQNANEQKEKKLILKEKLKVLDKIMIRPRFQHWRYNVYEINKQILAQRFRAERGSAYILKKYLDRLRIGTLIQKERKNKQIYLEQKEILKLKHKYFYTMLTVASQNHLLNQKFLEVQEKNIFLRKAEIFAALKEVTSYLKVNNTKNRQAFYFHSTSLAKKTFISLQKYQIQQQIHLMFEKRNSQRIQFNFFNQWRLNFARSLTLNKAVNRIQEAHTRKLQQQFYQRLVKLCFYQQINESMQSKRMANYCHMFIDLLKRNIIYSHIVHGFTFARNMKYKAIVFQTLNENRNEKLMHRTMIESQVNTVIETTNTEIIKMVFAKFKLYFQRQKMKKTAVGIYVQNLNKKAYDSLRYYSIQRRKDFSAVKQIKFMILQRFLGQWVQAIISKRQEIEVAERNKMNYIKQILNEWRTIIIRNKAVIEFRDLQTRQRLLPLSFTGLLWNTQREKHLKHCFNEIKQNHDFITVKEVILHWLDYLNLRKIAVNVRRFHSFKLLQQTTQAWRQQSKKNVKQRRILMYLRSQIHDKPYVVRPILAIKNVLLYQAFQLFKSGVKISSQKIVQRTNICYERYMRLLKKAFYSLQINVSKRQSRKKIRLLRNLFISRRWFMLLKQATQMRKEERRLRTESAIFKVLNVQRKAFAKLLQYASQKQQERIKKQFSEELYYKRLADKAIMALKLNLENAYKEQPNQVNQSQIQQKAIDQTYFSSSRYYEQELSQMAIECSAVMDFKEKKRLVTELYCKKLLFKCFASWANVTLCENEEEDYEDQNDSNQYSEDDQEGDYGDEVARVSCDGRQYE